MILHCKDILPDELLNCKFGCRIRDGELITSKAHLGEFKELPWKGILSKEAADECDRQVTEYREATNSTPLGINCFLRKIKEHEYEVIEYPNYSIDSIELFSLNAIDIITDWHDRYLSFIKNCKSFATCMTKGLDSRIILGLLLEALTDDPSLEFLLKSYIREGYGDEDFRFTQEVVKLPGLTYTSEEKLKSESDFRKKCKFLLKGVFSEWARVSSCHDFLNKEQLIELFNELLNLKQVTPFLDPKLLQIHATNDAMHILILCMYYPFLLELPVRTGWITYKLCDDNNYFKDMASYHIHKTAIEDCQAFLKKINWKNPNPVNSDMQSFFEKLKNNL